MNFRNWLIGRGKSIAHAFNGWHLLLKEEPNARIHVAASLVVVAMGFVLDVSAQDWVLLLLCIGGVFTAELFNTAIEELSDVIQPEMDPRIKKVKDISAGGVFFISIISLIVGLLIFSSYL